MKKFFQTIWADILAETPTIYKWVCGVLLSLGGSATTAALTYNNLPQTWQAAIPQNVVTGLAAIALLGSAIAKKQNVK